jgi:hypothetical protein
MLLTFALGMLLAVLVVGSASAAGSKTTAKKSTATPTSSLPSDTTTTTSPGDSFFVINGTVNAASDHEILGSSAFPNFTTGAVDNYYSMAHAHVDNSPFAEGTASPFDTGPIGQTAAAGNTQQPQYADARWPGDKDSGKATYGTEGQPYATAEAGEYRAKADASEAKNGLSGPGIDGAKTLPLPKGFDLKLRQALAGWRSKWQGPLGLKKPSVTTPAGTATVPKLPVTRPKLPVSKPPLTAPTATVPTPIATVTTPVPVTPPPGVTLPTTTLSSSGRTDGSRSLAALRTAKSPAAASGSPPSDGESLLVSSTSAMLIPVAAKPKTATTTTTTTTKTSKPKTSKTYSSKPDKTKAEQKSYALLLSGESSLGRVSLAGGQIVLEGIHVTASVTNDGTPSYKANVSVASATIGGIPVTIDEDGVHVAGQGQGLPYQQASDALNGALKQAGIQLFLVGPEVTQSSCGQGSPGGSDNGGGGGSSSSSNNSTTTTSSSSSSGGQLGSGSSCDQSGGGDMCSQSGTGNDNPGNGSGGSGPALPGATPTSTDQTDTTAMPTSCGSSQMCDQAGTGTTTGTTTSATPAGLGGSGSKSGTTTTSSRQSTTTTKTDTTSTTGDTSSSCGGSGLPSSFGSCAQSGTGGGTTTTSAQSGTTTTSSGDQFGLGGGMPSSPEMTVIATGVHLVFTQPVSPPGVPAQYIEHILGEVYIDSLATPAGDTALGGLGLSSGSSSLSSSSSSSCGGAAGGAASGASASGGSGSAVGGVGASGSAAGAGSAFGSGSQPGSTSLPVAFATALRKPLWLLLAYLVWQAIVVGTGWSLWNWRRGDPS